MKKNLSVVVFFLSMLSCLLINTAIVWAAQAIPVEAVKCANRGEYASKTAKTESDYTDAAKEYEKASSIAPWVAGYYFNIGVLREKANQPQSAAMLSNNIYWLSQTQKMLVTFKNVLMDSSMPLKKPRKGPTRKM